MTAGPGAGARASGGRPRRPVDGIVLLDKPAGLSSNAALQRARSCLSAEKAGHAGTLDPFATGMLPLCFGEATKTCGPLLGARKRYRARLHLGAATDSGDATGRVLRECEVPAIDRDRAQLVLSGFEGAQMQVPPMHSALKRDGLRLYELAHRGEEVERGARPIQVHRLELVSLEPASLEFEVECSKGTYVRVLGEDIARALGTEGHLEALRRLWVAPFAGQVMVELATLEHWAELGEPAVAPEWLLPVDCALAELPALHLDADAARRLAQGQTIAGVPAAPGPARAYGADGRLVALVEVADDGSVRVRRLVLPPRSGALRPADLARDAAGM